jgi:AcrR family transcriptional regulator
MPKKPPTLRARQAQLTRDEILGAARRLFAENGYSRTSVRDIAEAAGVSSQTVYDSIGSKQAIVARLNDLIDVEAGIAAIVSAGSRSGDPEQVLAVQAKIVRSILENCGDIIRALVSGAAAEPDLALVLAEGQRRHVDGARRLVGLLHQLGALDESVTAEAAVNTLAATTDASFALLLNDAYGWSLDEIEAWITATNRSLLLGRPSPPSGRQPQSA